MKFSKLTITGLLTLLLVGVSPVFAQSDRGGITGRVTDQTGAVVADAKVTVLNAETGETREAKTNGDRRLLRGCNQKREECRREYQDGEIRHSSGENP